LPFTFGFCKRRKGKYLSERQTYNSWNCGEVKGVNMKKGTTGKMLIEALNEAVDFHKGKVTLKTEQVVIPVDPPEYTSKEIKKIREKLNISQPIFAKYL
jgi:hypothetical protein